MAAFVSVKENKWVQARVISQGGERRGGGRSSITNTCRVGPTVVVHVKLLLHVVVGSVVRSKE
jgi:hypothetical protein